VYSQADADTAGTPPSVEMHFADATAALHSEGEKDAKESLQGEN
jgi:hypothetical protein